MLRADGAQRGGSSVWLAARGLRHGTGGSYHSIVDLGLSDDYAIGAAPPDSASAWTAVPVLPRAVGAHGGPRLRWNLHGTRNGGSTKAVGELVYNFLNPRAARDNALQAAADLLAIPHGLAGFAAQGVVLDGTKLALYGHSQGGNGASLVAARQSSYGTIVMSGTGGTLIYTLLGKTQPVNIPAVLPYLLGEVGPSAVDATHPVLGLMQMYFEHGMGGIDRRWTDFAEQVRRHRVFRARGFAEEGVDERAPRAGREAGAVAQLPRGHQRGAV